MKGGRTIHDGRGSYSRSFTPLYSLVKTRVTTHSGQRPIPSIEHEEDFVSQTSPRTTQLTKRAATSELDFSVSQSQLDAPQPYPQWTGGWVVQGNGPSRSCHAQDPIFVAQASCSHKRAEEKENHLHPVTTSRSSGRIDRPIMLRDHHDASSDEESSPGQHPTKRRRLDITPGPRRCVETAIGNRRSP